MAGRSHRARHTGGTEAVAVRTGRPADQGWLDALLDDEGMTPGEDASEFLVAEADGRPLGAARVERMAGETWIRPLAVLPSGRGGGVGMVLVRSLLERHGELHLVSRGEAAPFYEACGFVDAEWTTVPAEIREECRLCPGRAECDPRPMRRSVTAATP